MANHIAAIHVLKNRLSMSDDDYRVLLKQLSGKESCKELSPVQLKLVRAHFDKLAARTAGRAASSFEARRAAASPRERKVWALWNQLVRDGAINNGAESALNAWVKRQAGVDALRFCNDAQLDNLIEALKRWQQRGARDDGVALEELEGRS